MKFMNETINDESAQGLSEYSLVLSLIALVLVVILLAFGWGLTDFYEKNMIDIIEVM